MGYPVTWFDVGAAEDGILRSFYREVFGWSIEPAAETYAIIDTEGGEGINGGVGRSGTGDPWVSFYVETDDPGTLLKQAESMGAEVVMPVTEIPALTFAMFNDPDGLLIGVMTPFREAAHAVGPSAGRGPPVDWFEILGSDAERTQSFYGSLFGWTADDGPGPAYRLVDTGAGRGIFGGIGESQDDARWATVYARVPDVGATLERAQQRGGSRAYGPMDVDGALTTGAFRDPVGNPFGVYQRRVDAEP
jgi:uncharacterized protein